MTLMFIIIWKKSCNIKINFYLQKSPIIDFYPEDFKIDLNGKKFAWQGVALLPFVDEKRLFKALEPYYESLTIAESKFYQQMIWFLFIYKNKTFCNKTKFCFAELRNVRGSDRLYIGMGNDGYDLIKGFYTNRVDRNTENAISIDGMRGNVLLADDCVDEGATLPSPVNTAPVRNNKIYWYNFNFKKRLSR